MASRRTAARLAAFGCPVSYWSRRRRPPEQEGTATYVGDLGELIQGSEVLVNAVALTAETRGLLGRDLLGRLPAGALLVNVSRGDIVDEAVVAEMIDAGRLAGAAFDVYAVEPVAPDNPLLRLPPLRDVARRPEPLGDPAVRPEHRHRPGERPPEGAVGPERDLTGGEQEAIDPDGLGVGADGGGGLVGRNGFAHGLSIPVRRRASAGC